MSSTTTTPPSQAEQVNPFSFKNVQTKDDWSKVNESIREIIAKQLKGNKLDPQRINGMDSKGWEILSDFSKALNENHYDDFMKNQTDPQILYTTINSLSNILQNARTPAHKYAKVINFDSTGAIVECHTSEEVTCGEKKTLFYKTGPILERAKEQGHVIAITQATKNAKPGMQRTVVPKIAKTNNATYNLERMLENIRKEFNDGPTSTPSISLCCYEKKKKDAPSGDPKGENADRLFEALEKNNLLDTLFKALYELPIKAQTSATTSANPEKSQKKLFLTSFFHELAKLATTNIIHKGCTDTETGRHMPASKKDLDLPSYVAGVTLHKVEKNYIIDADGDHKAIEPRKGAPPLLDHLATVIANFIQNNLDSFEIPPPQSNNNKQKLTKKPTIIIYNAAKQITKDLLSCVYKALVEINGGYVYNIQTTQQSQQWLAANLIVEYDLKVELAKKNTKYRDVYNTSDERRKKLRKDYEKILEVLNRKKKFYASKSTSNKDEKKHEDEQEALEQLIKKYEPLKERLIKTRESRRKEGAKTAAAGKSKKRVKSGSSTQ